MDTFTATHSLKTLRAKMRIERDQCATLAPKSMADERRAALASHIEALEIAIERLEKK